MKLIKIGLLLTILSFLLIACGGAAPAAKEPEPQVEAPAATEEAVVKEEPAATEEMAEEAPATEEAMAEDEAMAAQENITIGMMKIVSHPALDAIQAGFLETLAKGGYVEGENLTIIDGNAEGDIATLTTIAQQFVDEGVDLIATTSTPA
jgi:hypothetical protein